MNFRKNYKEDPEINLIPLIDVLLVILIFLMVTTTYSKYAELQINLPSADADKQLERKNEITVAITASGQYVVNKTAVAATSAAELAEAFRRAGVNLKDPVVVINGDKATNLQAAVTAMEAARIAGYGQVSISTQTSSADVAVACDTRRGVSVTRLPAQNPIILWSNHVRPGHFQRDSSSAIGCAIRACLAPCCRSPGCMAACWHCAACCIEAAAAPAGRFRSRFWWSAISSWVGPARHHSSLRWRRCCAAQEGSRVSFPEDSAAPTSNQGRYDPVITPTGWVMSPC
jgi:biopolymer transport protein ExbD